jgi:hypothetical protein
MRNTRQLAVTGEGQLSVRSSFDKKKREERAKLTLGILPPADLNELLDIGDFGRHLEGPDVVTVSTGCELALLLFL